MMKTPPRIASHPGLLCDRIGFILTGTASRWRGCLAALFSGWLCLSGCAREPEKLVVETQIHTGSLLVSEIRSAENPSSLVHCPVDITNGTGEAAEMTFIGTGCSCYGLYFDGRRLKPGETLVVDPHSQLSMTIDGAPGNSTAERDYSASLKMKHPGVTQPDVSVHCHLMIYQDLSIKPQVLTCEHLPDQDAPLHREVTVTHVSRTNDEHELKLEWDDLPQGVEVLATKSASKPEPLEDGLWQRTWKVNLGVDPRTPMVESLNVKVSGADADAFVASNDVRLVVEQRRSIAFPDEIHFGQIPLGTSRKRRVLIASTDGQDLFISQTSAAELPAGIQLHLPDEPAPRQWLEFIVTPESAEDFSETITLASGHPDQPTFSIQLDGAVSDADIAEN